MDEKIKEIVDLFEEFQRETLEDRRVDPKLLEGGDELQFYKPQFADFMNWLIRKAK